jgi:hypothetical protein
LPHLRKEQKSVVTLLPYSSNANFADRITAANEVIAELSLKRWSILIPSYRSITRPEMTTDGIQLVGAGMPDLDRSGETPAGRFELACSSIKERAVSAMIRREKASYIAPAGLI